MPRRRIPQTSVPRRPDRRRARGNATDAQRRPHRAPPGQLEAIAERRVRALELRKSGLTFREISRQLGADLHTVHGDVQAELAALRERTVEQAQDLREMELARLDSFNLGLWKQIKAGSAPAVSAAVRVSERRAKLLGLDAPTASRTEVTGSLSVAAETRLKTEVEDLERWLTFEELRELGEQSERLFAAARALVLARSGGVPLPVLPSVVAVHDVRASNPTLVEPSGSAGTARPVLYGVEPVEGGAGSDEPAETTERIDITGGD